MVPRSSSPPRSSFLRVFGCFVIISEICVIRYLLTKWPRFNHPWEPVTPNLQDKKKQDATLNGFAAVFMPSSQLPPSHVHCIGENFEHDTSWMFRSCRFQNLCLDLQTREFVYLQSSQEQDLLQATVGKNAFMALSSVATSDTKVSLGSFFPGLTLEQERRLSWFPRIRKYEEVKPITPGYFELPANVVLVPFSSSSTSILWDDLFPIHLLLNLFHLTNANQVPFMVLHNTNGNERDIQGYTPFLKFMMGHKHATLASTSSIKLLEGTSQPQTSNLVCFQDAAAGIGFVGDHDGIHLPTRYMTKNPALASFAPHVGSVGLFTHNVAQGQALRGFRNHLLHNLGANQRTDNDNSSRHRIVFYGKTAISLLAAASVKSELLEILPSLGILSLPQQSSVLLADNAIAVASSCILVVDCCHDEAALAATLLPDKATLIILGATDTRDAKPPPWQLISNAAYFQTHWISPNHDPAHQMLGIIRHAMTETFSG